MSEIEFYPSTTNQGAMARFFDDKKLNVFETNIQKKPVYIDVVKVEIRTTGSRDIFVGPANSKWIEEFPQAWAAYQGEAVVVSGTPLNKVENLGRMEAAYYQTRGIKTAEQLAEVTDGNIGNFGHGAYLHREAARKLTGWQEDKKEEARQKESAKQAEEIEFLKIKLAELTAPQADAMQGVGSAAIALPEAPKKRRGRQPGIKLRKVVKRDTTQHSAANMS